MSAAPGAALAGEDQALHEWAALVSDNLEGRRLLDHSSPAVEPEPATLAQLGAAARINEVVSRLRAGRHAMADAAETVAGAVLAALVTEAARRPGRCVATWTAAHQVLGTLGDLLEQLATAAPDSGPDARRASD
jgi:hypothetical protein